MWHKCHLFTDCIAYCISRFPILFIVIQDHKLIWRLCKHREIVYSSFFKEINTKLNELKNDDKIKKNKKNSLFVLIVNNNEEHFSIIHILLWFFLHSRLAFLFDCTIRRENFCKSFVWLMNRTNSTDISNIYSNKNSSNNNNNICGNRKGSTKIDKRI